MTIPGVHLSAEDALAVGSFAAQAPRVTSPCTCTQTSTRPWTLVVLDRLGVRVDDDPAAAVTLPGHVRVLVQLVRLPLVNVDEADRPLPDIRKKVFK